MKEASRTFILLGTLLGSMSTSLANGIVPPTGASAPLAGQVVDANGVVMGPLLTSVPSENGNVPSVMLSISGVPVLLPLKADRKAPLGLDPSGTGTAVFFESSDCSGQGWVDAGTFALPGTQPSAVVATSATDATLFVVSTVLSKNAITFNSQLAKVGRCSKTNVMERAYPVEQRFNLSSVYAVPYHLQ